MSSRLFCSPLSGAVYYGRLNKAQTSFIGDKAEVTGDFLRAVVEKAEFHGGTFEIHAADKKWVVTVEAFSLKDSPPPAQSEGSRG